MSAKVPEGAELVAPGHYRWPRGVELVKLGPRRWVVRWTIRGLDSRFSLQYETLRDAASYALFRSERTPDG